MEGRGDHSVARAELTSQLEDPEVALAVSGVLAAIESAIWSRYGDEMMPLIAGVELPELEQVEPSPSRCGDDDRLPF